MAPHHTQTESSPSELTQDEKDVAIAPDEGLQLLAVFVEIKDRNRRAQIMALAEKLRLEEAGY